MLYLLVPTLLKDLITGAMPSPIEILLLRHQPDRLLSLGLMGAEVMSEVRGRESHLGQIATQN